MKILTKCRLIVFLYLAIICHACNRVAKSGNIPTCESYNTAVVMYPRINGPWEVLHFYSVSPESFTQDLLYKNHINKLVITDTLFLNRLSKSINSRDIQRKGESEGFDTWFMVLLSDKDGTLTDTLAVFHNVMWFNREIYTDSTLAGIITDEIIKHNKDFGTYVNDYYSNGKWYPYLGKELTNELLGETNNLKSW